MSKLKSQNPTKRLLFAVGLVIIAFIAALFMGSEEKVLPLSPGPAAPDPAKTNSGAIPSNNLSPRSYNTQHKREQPSFKSRRTS